MTFTVQGPNGAVLVATCSVALWGRPARIVALARGVTSQVPATAHENAAGVTYDEDRTVWTSRDEAGILRFHHRFRLLMDDVSSLRRTVPFSKYFAWMGKVRELALRPIMTELSPTIASGRWGMVTNISNVQIFGEAQAHDTIVGVLHAVRLPDSDDSTIDLFFDWHTESPSGALVPLAVTVMRTSWVRIVGHGLVEKHSLPPFLRRFLDSIGERELGEVTLPKIGLSSVSRGAVKASFLEHFGASPLLRTDVFPTDQEDANLVGNIYHSHYGKWQGRVRDRYFYSKAPAFFTQAAIPGDWACQHSNITYLRDAMPFDVIEVDMHLAELSEYGAKLLFSYFRREQNGSRTKLASGDQDVVWMAGESGQERHPASIPDAWRNAFELLEAVDESSKRRERVQMSQNYISYAG